MLLEFTIGNYRSFGEDTTLSMVSTALMARDQRLNDENRTQLTPKLSVLKSAVVYGANASGKSNLVRGMAFMRSLVVDSSRESQAGDPIKTEPFLLHPDLPDEPSYFEMVFRAGDTQYRYGFEVSPAAVEAEWLYRLDTEEICLFKRGEDGLEIMPDMIDAGLFAKMTRPNALFISVAAQFNQLQAMEVVEWFRRLAFLSGTLDESLGWTAKRLAQDPKMATRIGRLVARLDLGIQSLSAETVEASFLPDSMPPQLLETLTKTEHFQVDTIHAVLDDEGAVVGETSFDLGVHESGGTRKLFALAGPILDTLDQGKVLVVDEFDARLHPVLSRALIELFHGEQTNPHGAQLIVASHDTNLLDRTLLRRDQIWFIEKNKKSQSELYALASIKVRNDASYERDYLNGRYGAIPLPRRLAAVVAEMHQAEVKP